MSEPVLELRQIAKTFDLPDGSHLDAIRTIDLAVLEGSFTSVLGHSGCGKSTVLNMVAGLLEPTRGEVIYRRTGNTVDSNTDVSVVFQNPRLLPWRTVEQNVAFGLDSLGVKDSPERRRRVASLIEMVGLGGFEQTKPKQLSGGMQARTSIARALAVGPRLLLMDEPFSSLDEITARQMRTDLLDICEKTRMTVLFVTHDVSEAAYLSDEVIVLTPRPSVVSTRINVPIPRPRSYGDERLFEIEAEILHALNQAMLSRSPNAAAVPAA